MTEYAMHDTVVLAITADLLNLSKQIVQQYGIKIPILYVPNYLTGDKYGVYNVPGSMDMRPVDTHSIFIIEKKGLFNGTECRPKKCMFLRKVSIKNYRNYGNVDKLVKGNPKILK